MYAVITALRDSYKQCCWPSECSNSAFEPVHDSDHNSLVRVWHTFPSAQELHIITQNNFSPTSNYVVVSWGKLFIEPLLKACFRTVPFPNFAYGSTILPDPVQRIIFHWITCLVRRTLINIAKYSVGLLAHCGGCSVANAVLLCR